MNPKTKVKKPVSTKTGDESKVGQGFNDARGEIPDTEDIPKNNGQNVNNDPGHLRIKESKNPEA